MLELHFINTGTIFPYPYYIAVMSAIKTQKVSKVNLWTTTFLSGKYFDLIKDKVNIIPVEAPTFCALEGDIDLRTHVKLAHIKDYLQWKILYEHGGIYMDLDVVCIKDITDMFDARKVRVFPDDPEGVRINISIVIAPPKTEFIKSLWEEATSKLNNQSSIEWNEIGGALLIKHIKEHPDGVIVNDYGLAGHCVGAGVSGMFGEYIPLYNPDARVVHLFALANKDEFDKLDDGYVETRNTVYACLVRQVLNKKEWNTIPWELIKDCGGREKIIYEPNVNGYPMFLPRDEPYMSVSCRYNHSWEQLTTDYVKKNLKSGQTFIDVGASIGYYTLLASKIVGDTGRVVAFEPCKFPLGILKANIVLNNCKNVKVVDKAAAVGKGKVNLYMWGETNACMQYSLVHVTDKREEVEITSVDDEIPLTEPYYMVKIDVDGGEPLVLDGMSKLMGTGVPMDIVLEDVTGETVKRLEKDYGAYIVGEEKPAYNYWLERRPMKDSKVSWVDTWLMSRGQHYKPMFDYLASHDCFNILEIGTNNGDNAIGMIKTAAFRVPEDKIHYYGFDLFEELTSELVEKEFSLEKSPSMEEVEKKIKSLTKANITLIRGDTNNTLKTTGDWLELPPTMDFIYIDGGHAVDTIRNDWNFCSKMVKSSGVIFLDDYFPEMPFVGCKFLLNEIDKTKFNIELLPTKDTYEQTFGKLVSQLVKVQSNNLFRSIDAKEWDNHNSWEKGWWSNCVNTLDEQQKQQIYANYMKLDQFVKYTSNFEHKGEQQTKGTSYYNLNGKSILDIGGGPVSLLLRCGNFARAVIVDPCDYPKWVELRYESAGIEFLKKCAEDVIFDTKFDEVWIYNVLQHVKDPVKVIELAKKSGKKVRVCEPLNVGECLGHPHNLTKEMLDKAFERVGLTENANNHLIKGNIYFGVYTYE